MTDVLTSSLVSGVLFFLCVLVGSRFFYRNNFGEPLFKEVFVMMAYVVGPIIILFIFRRSQFSEVEFGVFIGASVVMPAIAFYFGAVRSWWN